MKTSFLLHKDSLCILEKMTDEQAGRFIKIIYQYQVSKQLPEMDLLMDMAITPFINQFLRDEFMYEKISEDRKVAGAKGGKKRVENLHKKKKTNKLEANQASASNFKQIKQDQANEANQADSDSDSDSEKDKERQTAFIKFVEWQKKNAPNVLRMKEPFTIDQYFELKEKYKPQELKELLESMHNYKPLLEKNVSAYLTVLNWARRREDKPVKNGNHVELVQTFHPALKNKI
jgi:hypothetical protein